MIACRHFYTDFSFINRFEYLVKYRAANFLIETELLKEILVIWGEQSINELSWTKFGAFSNCNRFSYDDLMI